MSLQQDALKQCNNKRELKEQLVSLPKGLDDAYAQIFKQSKRPEYLQTLMQWLVFSEEPLTVAQLAEVMAVDFTTGEVPFYDPELRCSEPEVIWGICNGLVTESEGAFTPSNEMIILTDYQERSSLRTSRSRNISSKGSNRRQKHIPAPASSSHTSSSPKHALPNLHILTNRVLLMRNFQALVIKFLFALTNCSPWFSMQH